MEHMLALTPTQENQVGAVLNQTALLTQANTLLDTMLDFKDLMLSYSAAIQLLRTRMEILDREFSLRYQRNPINHIETRLKSQTSIMEKMGRKGIPITRENIEENLYDIAGVRVICSYVDDIYLLADALIGQGDIELVERKDYIANPKPNGYRSLHLVVRVPVHFSDSVKPVYAEIQIRTIAMDFWASLEHQIKYKRAVRDPERIISQLKECADVISRTDLMMQSIRKEMDEAQPEKTEAEQIYEKLKRFDVNLAE